jgi:hypothetical protein
MPPGLLLGPRECGTRYAAPAGLPSTPPELTVMSRTPIGGSDRTYGI